MDWSVVVLSDKENNFSLTHSSPPNQSDKSLPRYVEVRLSGLHSFIRGFTCQVYSLVQTRKAFALWIYFVRAGNQCNKVLTRNMTIAATNSPPTIRIIKGRTENIVSSTTP